MITINITSELGRALAIVKVTLKWMGTTKYGGPHNYWGRKIKFVTNDYVVEGNPHAKFGNIDITGIFLYMDERYFFCVLPVP